MSMYMLASSSEQGPVQTCRSPVQKMVLDWGRLGARYSTGVKGV